MLLRDRNEPCWLPSCGSLAEGGRNYSVFNLVIIEIEYRPLNIIPSDVNYHLEKLTFRSVFLLLVFQ